MQDPDDSAPSPDPGSGPPPDGGVVVVGVGASAGGLEALEKFFDGVPSPCEMAFVVVMHLDPDRESQVAEILSRYAPFQVTQVTEAVRPEPQRGYVIAPHTQLEIDGDSLVPTSVSDDARPHHPIDTFFQSLADSRGSDAVGVVLSGTGDDGTLGLRRIREAGGITAVQTPEEAGYPSMPENAMATGMVELVLPAADIPGRIVEVLEAPAQDTTTSPDDSDAALDRITDALLEETGRDFQGYKRTTFLRRIDRRMLFNRLTSIDQYAALVESDGRERRILFKELLISVSQFFRDESAWEFLEEDVIPDLFADKGDDGSVRTWVPGCATGEEAYSLAMLLHEYAAGSEGPAPSVQVFATDIDEKALDFARGATYPETIAEDVSPARIQRFFTMDQDRYHVGRPVRDSVLFATHDVRSDPPFSQLDLVSCRNLLIYMEPEIQQGVLERLHYGLREGGILFLGSSESADGQYFEPISKTHGMYRRKPGPSPIPLTRPRARAAPRAKGRVSLNREDTADMVPQAVHGRLLGELGFPSAVVNSEYEIVHLSKGMGSYLHHGEGAPTANILELVPDPIRLELRTALYQAFKHHEGSTNLVRTTVEGEPRLVEVTVRPGPEDGDLETFALIVVEERSAINGADEDGNGESATDSMVRELEDELDKTKKQLQSTIEEREATIEELQSANEELQSVNEEQQAAQEELESRREELQSLNEELATVNQEYRSKIEELDELNADLQNLIQATEIATVFLGRNLRVRRFTPAATEIFNLRSQDEGRAFSDITHNLLDFGDLTEECRTVVETGEPVEAEARSANERWYNLRILPYRSSGGDIEGAVITCYDITDQKSLERNLREARNEALEADRAKGAFVATVSHELRTPLNSLLGYVQLLDDEVWGPLTEEQSTYLGRMRTCTRHLDFMIGQVLTFSRLEEGKESVDPEPLDVADLLQDVVAILEPQAHENGLDLEVDQEPDDLEMVTDPGKVRQILLNLGGNAVKFTDEGRVVLAAHLDDATVVFEVRDTGIGISPEDQKRIFERFWQAEPEGDRPSEAGTGLGLTVARGLVELLGGRLELESELGEGSVFRVRLPRIHEE